MRDPIGCGLRRLSQEGPAHPGVPGRGELEEAESTAELLLAAILGETGSDMGSALARAGKVASMFSLGLCPWLTAY